MLLMNTFTLKMSYPSFYTRLNLAVLQYLSHKYKKMLY